MNRNRINLSIALLCFFLPSLATDGRIYEVLKSVEANNVAMQANAQLLLSKKLEALTSNNLPDPSLSYDRTFGSPRSLGKNGEFIISQGFDFPTTYGSRNKLNRLKSASFDKQGAEFRQQLLLSAYELCLDLIGLNQEKQLLDERLANARKLSELYASKLSTGDASALEMNKINVELLNAKTESMMNETNRQTKLQDLIALNGNIPLEFLETAYSPMEEIGNFEQLKQEILGSNLQLQAMEAEHEVARKQITVSKSGWLPKFELGYRRDTGLGEQFNGFTFGVSIPLFENKHKVKQAQTEAVYADLQKQSTRLQVESQLLQLFNQSVMLKASMHEYDILLTANSLDLLTEALAVGEISLIEYFAEVSVIYQSKLNYMQLQNQYQKVMAQLFKGKL